MQPILPDVPSPIVVVTIDNVVREQRELDTNRPSSDMQWCLSATAFSLARELSLREEGIKADEVDILITYLSVNDYDTLRANEDQGVLRQSDEVHEHFLRLLEHHGANIIR